LSGAARLIEVVTITDPVCGKRISRGKAHIVVEPENAAGKLVHAGNTYYFCSARCQRTFQDNPQKYTTPQSSHPGGLGS